MTQLVTLAGRDRKFWQFVCDATVPGTQRTRLGDWCLRADLGETGRANSVWTVGDDPGRPLSDAVCEVERWYQERGRQPMFQLYSDVDRALVDELDRRSWVDVRGADVLAVRIRDALKSFDASSFRDLPVVVSPEPNDAFVSLTANDARIAEMRRTDDLRWFASVLDPQAGPLGCGLAIATTSSVGIFAMMTAPGARRKGVARSILRALLTAGEDGGASLAFLQVMDTNTAAQNLYRSLGFVDVERYVYRSPLDKSLRKAQS